MAELHAIKEPAPALSQPAPQWRAFWELGFRPLYLAGCGWAAVSVALWVYAPQWLGGDMGGVVWHAHEMLWGFIATIAVGFLLTASNNWTGRNPLQGAALAGLCALWLLARLGFLWPGPLAFYLAAGSELAFFAWAAIALGRVIYPARSRRNYGLAPLVLALGAADALYLVAARQGSYALLMQYFNAGLLSMAVVALLVARRVIPFFAMRAVAGLSIPMHTGSGQWQLGAAVLAIVLSLLQWPQAMAAALATTAGITLFQLLAWKPWAVRRQPLLWILYAGYAGLALGLWVASAQALGWITRNAWLAHTLGIAGFSVLIIGMVSRTALGHLGRALRVDRSMQISYGLVLAAGALRLLALWPTAYAQHLLHLSAAVWFLAFTLYLWRFFPMLIRPRADKAAPPPSGMPQRAKR